MASELTEQVSLKLAEQYDGVVPANFYYVYSRDANELIALITEACVEAVKTLGYPEDEIYAEAIRALGEVKE